MKNKILIISAIAAAIVLVILSILVVTDKLRIELASFIDSYDVDRPTYIPEPDKDVEDYFVEIKSFKNKRNSDTYDGSGIVIGNDEHSSYILTNEHVLKDVNSCKIDGILYSGQTVYISDKYDVSILKVWGKIVEPIKISTDIPTEGDTVYMVGNYGGEGTTTTKGTVKAIGEMETEGYAAGEMIISDALAYFGCSGGALVNEEGELVGLNRAIHTEKLLTYSISIREIWDEVKEYVGKIK